MMVPVRNRFLRQKWLWYAITLLVIAVALGVAYVKYHPLSRSVEVKRETVAVVRADVERVVDATGNIIVQNYVDVVPQVSGQISSVEVAIGEAVSKGKLLVQITPAVESGRMENNIAQLARMKAELAGQNAELDFAQLQFQRQTQLKAENATREEAYESSRMSMYSAAAKVEAINAQIRQVEAAIKEDQAIQKQTKVVAPIAGTVVALSARVGQPLNANRDVLMRIADLSKLSVQAQVAEDDVTRLRPGMIAYFTTPGYPGKRWSGKLRQIMLLPTNDSGVQGKKAYYTVLFDVANTSRELMAGMTANVFFVLAKVENVLVVPMKVIHNPTNVNGEQTLQVVRSDGKLETREIKTGINDGVNVEILSGVKEGEQILIPAVGSEPKHS